MDLVVLLYLVFYSGKVLPEKGALEEARWIVFSMRRYLQTCSQSPTTPNSVLKVYPFNYFFYLWWIYPCFWLKTLDTMCIFFIFFMKKEKEDLHTSSFMCFICLLYKWFNWLKIFCTCIEFDKNRGIFHPAYKFAIRSSSI